MVTNGTHEGTLITFNATVNEDNDAPIRTSDTVFVGTDFTPASDDTDGDGVSDEDDNCTLVPNADQRDTDNDNFGNVCDGDLDNSGFVNSIDFSLFKQRLFSNDPDADLDGNGIVNSLDFSKFKTLLLSPPGPSGTVQ